MALVNSKSVLAKLLAQENLTVEHRKTQTAYFDPKNRLLVLPIWKDMGSDLYDLLVGHEVGHAWETPAEGWHSEVTSHPKGFKSYLNVVEDARIEKKIKSRYPGLRPCFYRAYKELVERDFFGLSQYDINELPLIDRLNLHFKVGPFMAVPFEDEEKQYIDKMDKLDKWEDVVALAKELYARRQQEIADGKSGSIVDFDELSDYEVDYLEDGEESDMESRRRAIGAGGNDNDPESITDREFREREASLISDEIRPYVYASLPKMNTSDFIMPHKVLYEKTDWSIFDTRGATEYEKMYGQVSSVVNDDIEPSALWNTYKATNTKFIQYLVKEFELKRNAAQHARAQVSKTGELDLDKVFGYKYKTDLFKRVTKIPGGKNHGMVMLVDWSGSMDSCIKQTIEQTLVLADFCKKVSIPFRVFAFSDRDEMFGMLLDHQGKLEEKYNRYTTDPKYRHSTREGDLYFSDSRLVMMELLSNDMSLGQYNNAQKRLLQIGTVFGRQAGNRSRLPTNWYLNGTPLDEALVFANHFMPEFKEKYRLDIVNAIVLTDGESNETGSLIHNGKRSSISAKYGVGYRTAVNTVLDDKETGVTGYAKPHMPMTAALLDLMRNRTGCNLIGYYILNTGARYRINSFLHNSGLLSIENADTIMKSLKQNKFYELKSFTYDKYFLVKSEDLEIKDDELDVTTESSKRDIYKAFAQNQKSKVVNRVLLNKFIAEIA